MSEWHNVYLTDKSGKKFFNSSCSPMSTISEIKNLTRHLDSIKAGCKGYDFIDKESAELMLDGTSYYGKSVSLDDILDDDLLKELCGE